MDTLMQEIWSLHLERRRNPAAIGSLPAERKAAVAAQLQAAYEAAAGICSRAGDKQVVFTSVNSQDPFAVVNAGMFFDAIGRLAFMLGLNELSLASFAAGLTQDRTYGTPKDVAIALLVVAEASLAAGKRTGVLEMLAEASGIIKQHPEYAVLEEDVTKVRSKYQDCLSQASLPGSQTREADAQAVQSTSVASKHGQTNNTDAGVEDLSPELKRLAASIFSDSSVEDHLVALFVDAWSQSDLGLSLRVGSDFLTIAQRYGKLRIVTEALMKSLEKGTPNLVGFNVAADACEYLSEQLRGEFFQKKGRPIGGAGTAFSMHPALWMVGEGSPYKECMELRDRAASYLEKCLEVDGGKVLTTEGRERIKKRISALRYD